MNNKYLPIVGVVGILAVFVWWAGTRDGGMSPEVTPAVIAGENMSKSAQLSDRVDVVYFHATQRCSSCLMLSKLTSQTIQKNFAQDLAAGRMTFQEVNVDLPENKNIAQKYMAYGSSLYVNAVASGVDHIEQDTKVWQLLSDEPAFESYLTQKLTLLLPTAAAMEVSTTPIASDIILFFGDGCPHCAILDQYLEENKVAEKVTFEKREVYHSRDNATLLEEKALACDIPGGAVGVPFLWANDICYVGDEDIKKFFNDKLYENI